LILPNCGSQGLQQVIRRIEEKLESTTVVTDDGPQVIRLRIAQLFINGGEQYDSANSIYVAADAILTDLIEKDGGR